MPGVPRCARSPSLPALPQLRLDEAHAGEELEARMAGAGATSAGGQGLSWRTTSNLQLEVLSQQAVADELEVGDSCTAQTLHELCSSEWQPASQGHTARNTASQVGCSLCHSD